MSSEIVSSTKPSTPAVDTVLALPGFVYRMLMHLGDDGDFDAQDATLRLLCTLGKRHIVPRIAFNMLWRALHGLKRAIDTMPRDLFDDKSPNQWKPLLENVDVTLADWDRPLFCLWHVRELYLNQGPGGLDHFPAGDTNRILGTVHCNRILLTPNLHILTWAPPNSAQADLWAPYLPLFFGPSLSVFFMLVDNSLTVRDIFDRLPDDVCKQLQRVVLESRNLKSAHWTARGMTRLLGRLRDAEYVSTDQLGPDDAVMVGLGKLANLAFVEVIAMRGQNVPVTSDPLFRSLEHLQVIGTDPEHVADLIPVIRSDTLEKVSVAYLCGTAKAYELLFKALAHVPSPPDLEQICINDFDPVTYHSIGRKRSPEEHFAAATELISHACAKPADYGVPATSLRALAGFSNLKRLLLVLPLGLAGLTDELLDELTQNWPHLETLSLLPQVCLPVDIPRSLPIELTLGAFIVVATNCQNLHALGLVVDASAPPVGGIIVSDSPIHPTPQPVARFLACLFPRLCAITANADAPAVWGTLAVMSNHFACTWHCVQVALPEMAEIWERVPGKSWKDIEVVQDEDDLRWLGDGEEEEETELDW
ncbi:hypothetical protein MIND_00956700 [Mycena indigotica]|uniref:Uncharacterized protein n=1 Tax=Mycena indigotica TaxID=2126181 RepID=A0A8H6SEG2_9AGAR|nr:uncharacterized protein MIND_00956700 [Mycena indigotica]KAF7297236.1 hypothetical protein MIND_00956700 [Mycena indigotica]